ATKRRTPRKPQISKAERFRERARNPDSPDRVRSVIEWCAICGFSEDTGRRILASGKPHRVLGAYDARRIGTDQRRDLDEPRYPLSRRAAPEHETPEGSGLDQCSDALLCDQVLKRMRAAGLDANEVSKLQEASRAEELHLRALLEPYVN